LIWFCILCLLATFTPEWGFVCLEGRSWHWGRLRALKRGY
jgi:hypothetical protein